MNTAKNTLQHQAKVNHWQPLLSQWQTSGLSIAKFCEQHKLSAPQFYYWKKCLSMKETQELPLSWMPVKLSDDSVASSAPIIVRLSKAISIELRGVVAVATWSNLFAALEVTSC